MLWDLRHNIKKVELFIIKYWHFRKVFTPFIKDHDNCQFVWLISSPKINNCDYPFDRQRGVCIILEGRPISCNGDSRQICIEPVCQTILTWKIHINVLLFHCSPHYCTQISKKWFLKVETHISGLEKTEPIL